MLLSMEGDAEEGSCLVARRALARLLGDLERMELVQEARWSARERVASALGPDAPRLIAALVPARAATARRRPSVAV